ncbi:MAG: RNA polymerase sigma factor [Parcubacteria bacterium RAAC4_OD1_1]|nr:MAG: RNA polymerase sigma factor [Parcubacteria bacterium RAAC4_OD1_1]
MELKDKFESIYKLESDSIFRFSLLRVSDRDQALDITQEAFLRLWQSMEKGEKIISPKALLFKITHRLIIDWYRKKKSLSLDKILLNKTDQEDEYSYDIVDEKTTNDRIYEGVEGRFLIDKINELPTSYRHPVYLRLVEDVSPPEIAKIMGISANASSVRINRGIEELRKILGSYDDK